MATNELLTEEDIRQLIFELISVETAAREAQITQEAEARQAGDSSLNQLLNQEITARINAVSGLQTSTNASIVRIDGNVTQLQNLVNQRLGLAEQTVTGMLLTVNDLLSRLDVVQGSATTAGSIAKALFDAKAYTDQKISEVLDNAPQILDTLKELSDAIGGDGNFITTINQSIQDNKQDILDLLSQSLVKRQLIVLTQQHVDQGYIDLPVVDIIANSLTAFVNRLGIFQDEDFTVSVVGDSTRLTFINALASTGDEAIQAGEQLRVTYWTLT
jgi:hypothetical protein